MMGGEQLIKQVFIRWVSGWNMLETAKKSWDEPAFNVLRDKIELY